MDENYPNGPVETIDLSCHSLGDGGITAEECRLIVEEPLLITMGNKPVATLMCTPGDEIALTLGYLLTEGIIGSMNEVGAVSFCREEEGNAVRVIPAGGVDLACRLEAYRMVFSSCSICGREAIEAVTSGMQPFARKEGRLSPQAIFDLGEYMNSGQRFFKRTGGTHAAVLGQIKAGRLASETSILKEDIGRHNALDKAVGTALQRKMPLEESMVFLSGRMSFEMVAKAARAGISDLAAFSAPTALAVALARQLKMFMAGFARGKSAVVYAGQEAVAV